MKPIKFKTYKITINPFSDENSEKLCYLLNKEWGRGITDTPIFREGKMHIKHPGFALKWRSFEEDMIRISRQLKSTEILFSSEDYKSGLITTYIVKQNNKRG